MLPSPIPSSRFIVPTTFLVWTESLVEVGFTYCYKSGEHVTIDINLLVGDFNLPRLKWISLALHLLLTSDPDLISNDVIRDPPFTTDQKFSVIC